MINSPMSLKRLSIQQRLSLIICFLLLLVIAIYGTANYYSLKKATLVIARQRLAQITGQFSNSFKGQAKQVIGFESAIAGKTVVTGCIASGGTRNRSQTLAALQTLHRDSTWINAEVLDTAFTPVVQAQFSSRNINFNNRQAILQAKLQAGGGILGNIHEIKGSMYFPAIYAVPYNNRLAGYIIAWVRLRGSHQSINQFSQLVGGNAAFYLANTDGSLWTDLITPVKRPVGHPVTGKVFAIRRQGKLACIMPIQHTSWLILIEFPQDVILKGMSSFLRWIIAAGIVLIALGFLAAWLMSRNITRPIAGLTAAATALSSDNYATLTRIEINRHDELGYLAIAFNGMAAQVYEMHHELEQKVLQRTVQLERVNKELDAFSYSVSHDLRTPLRAVMGYATMLKEDYEAGLDDEARRIIKNIIANARMMGQLIDDLLAFSRLGKKELVRTNVDMRQLTIAIKDELLSREAPCKYALLIGDMPSARADEMMIKQVLLNLLSNAIKYSSKKEKPVIEAGAEKRDHELVYYIKDNGAGFSMTYAGKLFGVFQRLHSQEEFEGTGVGLALVKRIIEKHGGRVWAEGRENEGAVFYFTLPE